MASIILLITLVFEAAFALYRIATKSNHASAKSLVRIGGLVAFVLFTLVSVLQWGLRWYGLAVLLSILALVGTWTLIRGRTETKRFSARRAAFSAVGIVLLMFVALIPAFLFPQYTTPKITGKHPVVTVNYTYTDKSRVETFTNSGENRKLNVEFWYPGDGAGTYPLVVFDHGIMGMKTSNTFTFTELASNGYVVCSIDHPYLSLFTVDDTSHMIRIDGPYLQEYMDASNGKYDSTTTTRLEQKWMSWRVADIGFVLDTVLANAKNPSAGSVYQKINPAKIGLMGHSLGGESSAQVARLRNDIGAVVNLDADLAGEYVDDGTGKLGLNAKTYPVPILTILSDTLERLIAAHPDADTTIAVKHVTATAPDAYLVHFAGTDHMSFTDVPLTMPLLVSLINASVPKAGGQETNALATIEKMNDLVLQFFNAYLKGQGRFTPSPGY